FSRRFFCCRRVENSDAVGMKPNRKSKPIVEVLLFVSVVGILGWLFWPKAGEPGQAPPTTAGQPREPVPDAALAANGDGLAEPPAFNGVDPSTVQAALAALAQLQQQEQAEQARV